MREPNDCKPRLMRKYAEAEAVLSRFGLADVPPQPTPPQRARRPSNRRVRAMSAYQSNVKVEPPCVARSARTPGSIVSTPPHSECGALPQHPTRRRSAPVPTGRVPSLPGKGTMSSATSNRRLRVICWSGRSAWPLKLLTLISLGGSQ